MKYDLNEKMQLFVLEYVKDFNGAAAYQRAGYKSKGNAAEAGASRLLRNVKVCQAIKEQFAARADRVQIDADWVVQKLIENVARAMQAEPVKDREGNPTGEYRYDGAVANKALELLGRHLGMFGDAIGPAGAAGQATAAAAAAAHVSVTVTVQERVAPYVKVLDQVGEDEGSGEPS